MEEEEEEVAGETVCQLPSWQLLGNGWEESGGLFITAVVAEMRWTAWSSKLVDVD